MDLSTLTVKEASVRLRKKEISSVELTRGCLRRISEHDGEFAAFLSVSDSALTEAKRTDDARARGDDLHPLAGIPIAIKNCILIKGWKATAGSQMLENFFAPYNATVIERLQDAGMIFVGSTNMDEFALGSSTENSHFGPTKNPYDKTKVPGGTSGGSAAAVASGMVPAALGSDTGGSLRLPAALCGVVGMKPTYGRVSRYGLIAAASSLEQIGPLTRTVEDAAMILQAIEGDDPRDATTVSGAETTVAELIPSDIAGLKLGVPKEYFVEGMDEQVKKSVMDAIELLEKGGAQVREVSLPHAEFALAAYYIINPCEVSSNLSRFDGMRYGYSSTGSNLMESYQMSRAGFGAEAKRRIMIGTYALSKGYYDAYYKKALKLRTLIRQDFDEAFKHVDAIVSPTCPSVAWNIGEKFDDPLTMYLADIYTISANLAAIPAMSMPCGFVNNLPVGLQLMGKSFGESTLFRLGKYYQSVTDWHTHVPQL